MDWISVSDNLKTGTDKEVLVTNGVYIRVAFCREEGAFESASDFFDTIEIEEITHWMPIKPPDR